MLRRCESSHRGHKLRVDDRRLGRLEALGGSARRHPVVLVVAVLLVAWLLFVMYDVLRTTPSAEAPVVVGYPSTVVWPRYVVCTFLSEEVEWCRRAADGGTPDALALSATVNLPGPGHGVGQVHAFGESALSVACPPLIVRKAVNCHVLPLRTGAGEVAIYDRWQEGSK